jgi:truncated hemoglobin YjbI
MVATDGRQAPHPIPAGSEGKACPIAGLFADEAEFRRREGSSLSAAKAFAELEADPDIAEERKMLNLAKPKAHRPAITLEPRSERMQFVPLNVINRSHKANRATKQLVRDIGGLPTLRRFTTIFYKKAFVDPHVDQFIRKHTDPHGERFACWIAEKFGDGTPWTDERRTRPQDLMKFGANVQEVAFDRSSAHFAAWHSPKREAHKWGQHFKPDDARVWMRLHFWAAREAGLFEPQHAAFMDYYIRFIGHFISIYSSKSPPFTRESARWSADPRNIDEYLASGNHMSDVIDMPVEKALAALPADERVYTGSGHPNPSWPYEMSPRWPARTSNHA